MINNLGRRSLSVLRNYSKRQINTTSQLNQDVKQLDEATKSEIEQLEETAEKSKLTSIDEFRVEMAPFLKELFCGRFNTIVLSYPDTLTNDRYFNVENKLLDLRKALESRQDYIDNIQTENYISKDLIMSMRSHGLFAHRGSLQDDGEGYSITESLRFLEEVANASLSLSNIIVNSAWYGAEVLRRHGSPELKKQYLPGLHNGTSICALCVADDMAGTDANSASASILQDPQTGTLTLSGDKLWVTNGANVDIFIVWAKQISKYEDGVTPRLTAVLVDAKNSAGITVSEHNYPTRGLKGCGFKSVKFDNVQVPLENQIAAPGQGFHILTDCLKDEAKLAGCVQIIAGLRKALNRTIAHAHGRRAFGSQLSHFDLVSQKIGLSSMKLFALESMVYMTAGLHDHQKDPDICLEATACRLFAAEVSKYIKDSCKSILGAATYLSDNNVVAIFDDIEGLNWWESSEDLNTLYLGLGGLAYGAEYREASVKTLRNPFNDIYGFLKQDSKRRGDLKLRLKLHEDVHPSLADIAQKLEKMVLEFDRAVEHQLELHGADIQLAEIDVGRLARISSYLYAMISALARANRSYCDGHAHNDLELRMCLTFITLCQPDVMQLIELSGVGCEFKIDPFVLDVSHYMFDRGAYATVHPLTKNIF